MVRTLDARTSLGSNGVTPLNAPLAPNVPTLVGILGLNIFSPGPLIRTQFNGTYRISVANLSSIPSAVRFEIYRSASNSGTPVYVVQQPVFPSEGSILASFEGSDYNVPAPPSGQLIYSCYVTFVPVSPSEVATRVGPECFNAVAYSDD
ncbi:MULTISPECIES: hypothetical protein [Paenibacillus]|uniref:Uncharacterized protein n=1 Tax=Paenibacillus vandeheii TaxID=3035917 RepID=A0ABT8JJT5_9BACL|nr:MULTISPECIES: hypothetical protein [Paenibacillus]KGP77736.1 hypothetical protein P363_0133035 [Paenibacillus sp. MAEPY1]KGP77768.1 hypothetical protein P364_0131765 [Paenibacillus sp. MAEPY2]MDN4605411.1 hypothetical protein [Paenibacillus vandeheii]